MALLLSNSSLNPEAARPLLCLLSSLSCQRRRQKERKQRGKGKLFGSTQDIGRYSTVFDIIDIRIGYSMQQQWSSTTSRSEEHNNASPNIHIVITVVVQCNTVCSSMASGFQSRLVQQTKLLRGMAAD